MQTDMKMDPELNQRCGNLSTIALAEVGRNFTNGIVGPFTIKVVNAGGRMELQMTGWLLVGLGISAGLFL